MASKLSRQDLDLGIGVIETLSGQIGPRPPASDQEAEAAAYVAGELDRLGCRPRIEQFASSRSFGPAYLITFGLAAAAGLMRRGPARYLAGLVAALAGIAEGRFSRRRPSTFTKWRVSRNVVGSIEPAGEPLRTVCLISHLDSSRSGLMFHPRVASWLGRLVTLSGLALMLQAVDPLIGRGPGRWLIGIARVFCAVSAGLVLEREVRGVDVAGANDNASGVGACLALASRFSDAPLESTRIVVLVTGSEESGVRGILDFLDSTDPTGWYFVNFDGVSAEASLRVLSREGGPLASLDADPGLLALTEQIGTDDPGLKARPLPHGSGLPYDSTPVLARGGRAISVVNQDGAIPDYHWPSDRFDHVSAIAFEKAVRFGEALLARIDLRMPRGESVAEK